MTEVFGEELREQLTQARQALRQAREAEDEDGVEFYADRVFSLLWLAAEYGIDLPHEAEGLPHEAEGLPRQAEGLTREAGDLPRGAAEERGES